MLPPPEAETKGAVVDPVLGLKLDQIAFDRRPPVGALVIGLCAQFMRPVDPLTRQRYPRAQPRRFGVAAALRRADLALALPVLPEFRRCQPGALRRGGRVLQSLAFGAIGDQPRLDLRRVVGMRIHCQLGHRLDVGVLAARDGGGEHVAHRVGRHHRRMLAAIKGQHRVDFPDIAGVRHTCDFRHRFDIVIRAACEGGVDHRAHRIGQRRIERHKEGWNRIGQHRIHERRVRLRRVGGFLRRVRRADDNGERQAKRGQSGESDHR